MDGYEADEIEDRDYFTDANELLGRDTDNDGTDEIEIEYDLNGNTTCTDDTPGGGAGGRLVKYRYDAWNRLVAIDHEEGESTYPVAQYQYNALHHRVLVRVDGNPEDSTHTLNQQRVLYYSPAWQVLEERIGDSVARPSPAAIHLRMAGGDACPTDACPTGACLTRRLPTGSFPPKPIPLPLRHHQMNP